MKKFLLSLAIVLLACVTAKAQASRYDNVAYRASPISLVPNLLPGASIAVCTSSATVGSSISPCSPLATTYTDSTGSVPCTGGGSGCANPSFTSSVGAYGFWVTPGQYTVQIYGPGITTQFMAISAPCVAGCGGVLLSGNNAWSGNETHSGTEGFSNTTTFSGVANFNAAANFSAGGSLAGTFSGSPAFANPSFTGIPSFAGTSPFTVTSNSLINNLNSQFWSGVSLTNGPTGGQVPIAITSSTAAWGNLSGIAGVATTGQLPGSGVTTVNGVTCTIGSSCTITSATNEATLNLSGFAGGNFTNPGALGSPQAWLNSAHTLTRIYASIIGNISGCAGSFTVAVYDFTSAATVSSISFGNTTGPANVDSGALSVGMTSGHVFGWRVNTGSAGCTGGSISIAATYQ